MNREEITGWLEKLQGRICGDLEAADGGAAFISDRWERPGGGGGLSRVISGGNVLEKGGVMYSAVHGEAPSFLLKENTHSFTGAHAGVPHFFATGISIVLHPASPHVPIIHMNTRYFELVGNDGTILKRWFGGGIDLTPHYVDKNDAAFFHQRLKAVCDQHDAAYYRTFKAWADDYFYIPHRRETRGIGGIFFDKLGNGNEQDLHKAFSFWKDVGAAFSPLYTELVDRHRHKPFSDEEKRWQQLRRGRYVEFNLIYDKGTRFGLESDGRIESILVSLPKTAGWEYNFVPAPGSAEERTLGYLKKEIDWIRE